MGKTKIEWTEFSWNPMNGCKHQENDMTIFSDGCTRCYARKLVNLRQEQWKKKYPNGFAVTLHPEMLKEPYRWKNNRLVFVCSMGDLFHDAVPFEFIRNLFNVMNDTPQHTYQLLTKRAENLVKYAPLLTWTDNIHMGVTVEHIRYKHRIDLLRQVRARIRFLSCEPLLGSLSGIDLTDIHWVIAQGETGDGFRIADVNWFRELRDNCQDMGIPFFFKGYSAKYPGQNGSELDGMIYKQKPN